MTDLYLTYSERHYGGDPINPEDAWPDYNDEINEWSPTALYLERGNVPEWRVETISVDEEIERGDTVFLVVIRYGSGNTFGRTLGLWQIDGIYKDPKEATKIADDIRTDAEYETRGHWEQKIDPPKGYPRYPGVTRYYPGFKPWQGYFESFEDVEVHTMLVL